LYLFIYKHAIFYRLGAHTISSEVAANWGSVGAQPGVRSVFVPHVCRCRSAVEVGSSSRSDNNCELESLKVDRFRYTREIDKLNPSQVERSVLIHSAHLETGVIWAK